MPVIAIAPPTMIATIGTNRPPKLITESTNLMRRLPQAKALLLSWAYVARLKPRPDANPINSLMRNLSGGADRDRTGGLLVANQALSQLSYSPTSAVGFWASAIGDNMHCRSSKPDGRSHDFGGPG
jgi:hypothetical protein